MKQISLRSFALWGVVFFIALIVLLSAVFLLILPRISAQEQQNYSLVSCPLQNGAPAGSIYYKSADLKYLEANGDSLRQKYPESNLYRYYIEREDELKFYLTLNIQELERKADGGRQLGVKGDTVFSQQTNGKKFNPGFLKLNVFGPTGKKLTVLDFGQLSGGDINPQQYTVSSGAGKLRFVVEYSYSDSDIYGSLKYKCELEDLIQLD